MPQLDCVSYFSQIIWIIVLLVVLFVSIVEGILPSLRRVFWFREFKKYSCNSSFYKVAVYKVVIYIICNWSVSFFSIHLGYFGSLFVRSGLNIGESW